jgi:hypothetical protein
MMPKLTLSLSLSLNGFVIFTDIFLDVYILGDGYLYDAGSKYSNYSTRV